MGRRTYHIQGLPTGRGRVPKEERKHDLGNEAWTSHPQPSYPPNPYSPATLS